jgi:hypothetical protein
MYASFTILNSQCILGPVASSPSFRFDEFAISTLHAKKAWLNHSCDYFVPGRHTSLSELTVLAASPVCGGVEGHEEENWKEKKGWKEEAKWQRGPRVVVVEKWNEERRGEERRKSTIAHPTNTTSRSSDIGAYQTCHPSGYEWTERLASW